MKTHRRPESWPARLRWVLAESVLVGAVFAFWLAVAALLTFVFDVLAWLLAAGRAIELRFRRELLTRVEFRWAAVVPLTAASATLSVLARAGTVLVDRYQRRDVQYAARTPPAAGRPPLPAEAASTTLRPAASRSHRSPLL